MELLQLYPPDVVVSPRIRPNGHIANTWFSFPGGKYDARGLTSGSGFELWEGSDCPSTATLSPSPSPPPPPLEEQCPISTSTADAGYVDAYRGWYDASGCGICQDYCRWVGNSGPGGDPSKRTTHGSSRVWSRPNSGYKIWPSAYPGKTERRKYVRFRERPWTRRHASNLSLEEQCPIAVSTADAGYVDAYRGWQGCLWLRNLPRLLQMAGKLWPRRLSLPRRQHTVLVVVAELAKGTGYGTPKNRVWKCSVSAKCLDKAPRPTHAETTSI